MPTGQVPQAAFDSISYHGGPYCPAHDETDQGRLTNSRLNE